MRLLLGIPTNGDPTPPFLESLAALRLPDTVTDIARSIWSGNFVAAQREMLLREAVDGGYDLLAMIDDDMVVPVDGLERLTTTLLDDPRTAIAGALYYSRDGVRPMAVEDWRSEDTTAAAIPAYAEGSTGTVDGVGFGCAVMRVAAIAALARPYLAAHVFVDRGSRRVTQCDEDYLLCERLRGAGHVVRLDAGVRCGHFDRGSGQVSPARWESDEVTNRRRMIVSDGGRVSLTAFDGATGRVTEHHERIDVQYLLVENPRAAR